MSIIPNDQFYNSLSSDYDEMIKFENSLRNKTESLKKFIKPNDKDALDLGCGTGIDSIALTKLGLMVRAVDHSEEMIKRARINAKKYGSNIEFIKSNLAELSTTNRKFDLIVSLGNTIANLAKNDLDLLFDKLIHLITSSGKIVIQLINYSKLPNSGEYILNKFENESIVIIRKYNIYSTYIDFIVDKLDKKNGKKDYIVTKLYPQKKSIFINYAQKYSFHIELFGNLKREPFKDENSTNLVIELRNKNEKTS